MEEEDIIEILKSHAEKGQWKRGGRLRFGSVAKELKEKFDGQQKACAKTLKVNQNGS